MATTGLWYHRLCRAVSNDTVVGSLSRQLAGTDHTLARKVIDAITALPEDLEVISLRALGWPMAQLVADGHRLNLLALEALAAAKYLAAEIWLSTSSEGTPLHQAALREALTVSIIGPPRV